MVVVAGGLVKLEAAKYDRFSVVLHWLMAFVLIFQLVLGLWMLDLPKGPSGIRAYWFNIHKSCGMLLGLLILVRAAWACLRPRVQPALSSPLMRRLAAGSHVLLYVLMLALPLSGFLGSVFSGYPIRFFGLRLPQLAQRWDAGKEWLSLLHHWTAYALIMLVVLHLLAFLHHQFILKDALARRMRY